MITSESIWHTMFKETRYYTSQSICALRGQHKEVSICKCGQNTTCYNCGYGKGASPCNCDKSIVFALDNKADIEWQLAEHIELNRQL